MVPTKNIVVVVVVVVVVKSVEIRCTDCANNFSLQL